MSVDGPVSSLARVKLSKNRMTSFLTQNRISLLLLQRIGVSIHEQTPT